MARLYGPGPHDPPPLIATNDLAGLSTSDVEGRPVGTLFGALSEQESGLIRYLDVDLSSVGRHVLVPIGHARIDRKAAPPRVRLRAATFEDLCAVPEYRPEGTALDAGYQEHLMEAHGQLFYGSRYYAHPAFEHRSDEDGPTDIIGPEADAERERTTLRPLAELPEFRVAARSSDIRGWPLDGSEGEYVGDVRELLVEPAAHKARYAVIRLSDTGREAALPVGYIDIDVEGKRTHARALTRADIRLLPPYEPPLDREQETRLHAALEARLSGSRYFERADFWAG